MNGNISPNTVKKLVQEDKEFANKCEQKKEENKQAYTKDVTNKKHPGQNISYQNYISLLKRATGISSI